MIRLEELPVSDTERGECDSPPPPVRRKTTPEPGGSYSGDVVRLLSPWTDLTDAKLAHLLLAKRMVAVNMDSMMRRLQRRLSVSLQSPSLESTMRVKIILDGFERAVLHTLLPGLKEVREAGVKLPGHLVAWTHADFQKACFFPFHALGFREAKLFKPKRVSEARAICWYARAIPTHTSLSLSLLGLQYVGLGGIPPASKLWFSYG